MPRYPLDPLDTLALSLALLPLSPSLSRARPNAAVAAAELPHGHSHLCASPLRPELRLVPLFLLAKPRKPRITMPSSSSSSPPLLLAGLRRSIRHLRRFPEHAGHPYVTT